VAFRYVHTCQLMQYMKTMCHWLVLCCSFSLYSPQLFQSKPYLQSTSNYMSIDTLIFGASSIRYVICISVTELRFCCWLIFSSRGMRQHWLLTEVCQFVKLQQPINAHVSGVWCGMQAMMIRCCSLCPFVVLDYILLTY
jgi:hypothetical protein